MIKRINQLVSMFSYITGKTKEESLDIILQTETGNAALRNDEMTLYEQQTENLYSIALELEHFSEYKELGKMLTEENIVKAMKHLKDCGDSYYQKQIILKPFDAEADRVELLKKQKKFLKMKNQNRINIWRMENADKTEK